ncbi:hypothetical protein [Candidatus Sororendozoicomonas aggregata]|uniref:hypothetical protein n=1 Tax=Candidatus Sororendozoicomonas aggregata TaxID=3073239 RepID=UPI002ECFF247
MNKVLPVITTFIYMMFFTNASFAAFHQAESLEVFFTNNTDYKCTLDAYLKHGEWHRKPPKSVSKHSVVYWIAEQGIYGPDIIITFNCGGYSFSTKNQQNFSEFEGGDQHCSTFDVDKHLYVTNKQTQHAAFGSKLGKAEIYVALKGR